MTEKSGYQEEPGQVILAAIEGLIVDFAQRIRLLPRSYKRDLLFLRTRYELEGLGFLTNCLPHLDKVLLQSLESGTWTGTHFHFGFKVEKGRKTPRFLSCFFRLVFQACGCVTEDASLEAIRAIRQITAFASKLERPVGPWCKPFIDGFTSRVQSDAPVRCWDGRLKIARSFIDLVFKDFNPLDIVGKHGPGAVAEGLNQDQKLDHSSFSPEAAYWWDRNEFYTHPTLFKHPSLGPGHLASYPSRVVLVPKSSSSPRLIAAEMSGHAFLQGGLNEKLVKHIEKHWLTSGHVNFTDQSVNQQLAQRASQDLSYVTIDLSDASDLLRSSLVQELFRGELGVALSILRTKEVIVNGTIYRTSTFSTMGNGLTFPVMSIVLCSILVGAVLWKLGTGYAFSDSEFESDDALRPQYGALKEAMQGVYVYGDDLIVPTEHASCVLEALIDFGFKPNQKKCFATGFFRESCGADYYKGTNVRPVYIRKYPQRSLKRDAGRLSSTVACGNLLQNSGLIQASTVLLGSLKRVLPLGYSTSPYLCVHTDKDLMHILLDADQKKINVRWNRGLQRFEIRASRVKTRKRVRESSEAGRYFAALTRRLVDQTPFFDDGTRPSIKTGWMAVY